MVVVGGGSSGDFVATWFQLCLYVDHKRKPSRRCVCDNQIFLFLEVREVLRTHSSAELGTLSVPTTLVPSLL